jgi:hypothetical protein
MKCEINPLRDAFFSSIRQLRQHIEALIALARQYRWAVGSPAGRIPATAHADILRSIKPLGYAASVLAQRQRRSISGTSPRAAPEIRNSLT